MVRERPPSREAALIREKAGRSKANRPKASRVDRANCASCTHIRMKPPDEKQIHARPDKAQPADVSRPRRMGVGDLQM